MSRGSEERPQTQANIGTEERRGNTGLKEQCTVSLSSYSWGNEGAVGGDAGGEKRRGKIKRRSMRRLFLLRNSRHFNLTCTALREELLRALS